MLPDTKKVSAQIIPNGCTNKNKKERAHSTKVTATKKLIPGSQETQRKAKNGHCCTSCECRIHRKLESAGKTVEQIHESHCLLQQYPLNEFRNYDAYMQMLTSERRQYRGDQQQAFERHHLASPRGPLTDRGEPYCDTHPDKPLLVDDVRLYICEVSKLKLSTLREMREDYKEISLKCFGSRVHQEKLKQRNQLFWQQTSKKMARKEHGETLEEMKKDWIENNEMNEEVDGSEEDCEARLNLVNM